jgi:multiple sugar transport system ATP-binding protein
VRQPQVFLMDEPLSNLDAQLRVQTRAQISALQRRLGVTTLYVTHDQTEALTMGDRIAVLLDGRLQQVGTPRELYDRPVNVFTAGFIGSPSMSLIPARVEHGGAWVGSWRVPLEPGLAERVPAPSVTLGLRSEDVRLLGARDEHGLPATVERVEFLGSDTYLYSRSGTGEHGVNLVTRMRGRHPAQAGDAVSLGLPAERLHVFDTASGLRLT